MKLPNWLRIKRRCTVPIVVNVSITGDTSELVEACKRGENIASRIAYQVSRGPGR